MHNFLIGKFKVINFKTGAQLNTDYTIPLWVLFLQYRAAVVSGQVIMNGAMRDGINNNAISTASSENCGTEQNIIRRQNKYRAENRPQIVAMSQRKGGRLYYGNI